MRIYKENPSKIRIFGERDFWVNGIIGAISLSSIVPFYLDVLININTLPKNENLTKTFFNNEFMYYIDKDSNIFITSISKTEKTKELFNTQPFKLLTKEHFWVSGLKRNFDLSPLIQLYLYVMNNFEELSNNVREFTIGRCTIVFQVDEEKNINLITGWTGSRKKIN